MSRIVSVGWISNLVVDPGNELFALPCVGIHPEATKVHGHTIETLIERGALDICTQLTRFLVSLENLAFPIVLVAHNGKSYDTRVLRAEMERCRLEFPANVIGFADSMLWLRHDRAVNPANMDHLLEHCGLEKRNLHGALDDARALRTIVNCYDGPIGFFESKNGMLERTVAVTLQVLVEEMVEHIVTSCDC
jgi:DNA polymerase III epsilon subunit-like protein